MADGQKVDINGMFSVGGCKMRYPGDVQNGTAAEIYNCRCTMCTVEPPEIMQGEEPRMTYSEWVKTKEEQEATGGRYAHKSLDNGGGSGIIGNKEPVSIFLNSSERLYENAKKIQPLPDYQDIIIHGDKTGFAYKDKDGNETLLNVTEFSKILKESGLYKGEKIRLISCETAADGAFTAQWLADDMGVEILAPTDIVWIDQDGNMTIGPDEFTDSGTWVTIKPNKKE